MYFNHNTSTTSTHEQCMLNKACYVAYTIKHTIVHMWNGALDIE